MSTGRRYRPLPYPGRTPEDREQGLTEEQAAHKYFARVFSHLARAAFEDQAAYLGALPKDGWTGPTGCSEWTVRDLAGHVVGEAVWFANLVRGVTVGEKQLPYELYEEMKSWPDDRIVETLADAAAGIERAVAEADSSQLEEQVDLGFVRMPVWRATYVSADEAVIHGWDLHVGRDSAARIPVDWAVPMAEQSPVLAPVLAHRDGIAASPGVYLLVVGDGVGPIAVTARNGRVRATRGAAREPDVAVNLTADQYLRLITGRLPLGTALERGDVSVEGDNARARGLNRIFSGV